MTREAFAQWASQGVILLDGATGSNLMAAGKPRGVCTEQWVLEHPQVLQELQRAYVAAGSQIVYAPTFGANRHSLSDFGLSDQVREINRRLVELCREGVGSTVLVAGDLTTTGKMVPQGDLTYEDLLEIYKEQIESLAEAGVDLLVAETMLGVEETMAALDAAAAVCDLPMMCSLSLEADGTALFGGNAVEAMVTLQEMGACAVGLNCSVGPDQLRSVVAEMKKVARVPVIAKPNAGMPVISESGEAIYSMDAEHFAEAMLDLVDAGASLIGGCCGTTPAYILAMRKRLEKRSPSAKSG